MATTRKPASKKAQPAEQPATGKTVKDLAKALGRDPKSVRAAIRRLRGGGAQVGRGNRYNFDEKEYGELMDSLSPKAKQDEKESA